jgi:hypothetical protein
MHVIHAEADSPLLIEEGWTRPQENIAEGILGGAAGVVRHISDHHPVCASEVASQLFLIAQPPLPYEEGTTGSKLRI